jgi:septal ring factor EnvC (AmiA/AmiB activator)
MSRQFYITVLVSLALLLNGCDFLEEQQKRFGFGTDKKKSKPTQSVEQQIETVQKEMATLEQERTEIESKRQQILSDQAALNKLLQETEAEIQRLEATSGKSGGPAK